MMLHSTALVLVESTDSPQVLNDPANADWLAVVHAVTGDPFNQLACRYYLALGHLRKQRQRSPLPGTPQITAPDKQLALRGMLDMINQHQGASAAGSAPMFVDAAPGRSDETLPIALRDPTMKPPPLSSILSGPGRPPCDALCLLRAFLAAPLMGCNDSPAAVHLLLRSNPTFARACDFCGPTTPTEPGELTSRRLPSLSTCEEFSEVMTRYGLWQLARITAVRNNIASGVVARDDTAAFDTTHIVAN